MKTRLADLRFEPLALSGGLPPGVRLEGAWQVRVDDPRFAGLSALAVRSGGSLLGLTDSGVLVELPKPTVSRRVARLSDLADGPGYPTFKKFRDSEALVVEPGRGRPDIFWISFESRHSVWMYTADGRSWGGLALRPRGWRPNRGVEAMVVDPAGDFLLLPEDGSSVLILEAGRTRSLPLVGATGGIADAVRLPGGQMVVAVREVGLRGLTNRLAWLIGEEGRYRLQPFATLPLGPFDNVEGLAAEPAPGGGTFLWAITDNDGWRRTLLMRLRIDETVAPAKAEAAEE